MRPQPGDLINGKYRLIRLIGDGGMGSVFEARHEYLGTVVALKFLHSELASRPGLVARFLREARLSASIKSDHIARVSDVDQAGDGAAYLVMELLEGQSLRGLLDREGRLAPSVALDYTLQMLDGLEAAHAIGVVHRDLKPDNVFIVNTPKGPLIKLLDFGIAKLTKLERAPGRAHTAGRDDGNARIHGPRAGLCRRQRRRARRRLLGGSHSLRDARRNAAGAGRGPAGNRGVHHGAEGTPPEPGRSHHSRAAFGNRASRDGADAGGPLHHRVRSARRADAAFRFASARIAAPGRGVPATLPPDAGPPTERRRRQVRRA